MNPKIKKIIMIGSTLIVILFAVFIYFRFYFVFGEGVKAGEINYFVHKGYIFKTYEGEIVQPGLRSVQGGSINTNNLMFSVVDVQVADSLNNVIGKTVKLHYIQYRKNLPWRGENYNGRNQENGQYIIDRIESVSTANTPVTGF